jgi:hypothetical protein
VSFRLRSEIDLIVRDFDLHLARCDLCLVEGSTLCYEGQYLVDEADHARTLQLRAAAAADRPTAPRFPLRRPLFPGVGA